MSWREAVGKGLAAAALVAVALVMAGCTFRPLYVDQATLAAGTGEGVGRPLSRIVISELSSRDGIALRNELIFLLGGGGTEPTNPEYRLDIGLSTSSSPLAIQSGSGIATTQSATITGTYSLVRLRDGTRVFTATATSRATFDRSVQRFANIRAERDAFDRAARELAEMIRIGLASYFARTAAS